MNTIRTAVAAAALVGAVGVLAACSASETPDTTTPASSAAAPTSGAGATTSGAGGTDGEAGAGAGTGAQNPQEQQVVDVLRAYQSDIVGRNFEGACAAQAQETTDQLLESVRVQNPTVSTCPDALALVFMQQGAIEVAAESAQSTVVDDVSITGDTATISWNHDVGGEPRTDRIMMRSVNDQWRILPTVGG